MYIYIFGKSVFLTFADAEVNLPRSSGARISGLKKTRLGISKLGEDGGLCRSVETCTYSSVIKNTVPFLMACPFFCKSRKQNVLKDLQTDYKQACKRWKPRELNSCPNIRFTFLPTVPSQRMTGFRLFLLIAWVQFLQWSFSHVAYKTNLWFESCKTVSRNRGFIFAVSLITR